MMPSLRERLACYGIVASLVFACSQHGSDTIGTDGGAPDQTSLSREALLDPRTCRECHPTQYQAWAGSMHAYASRDPVFLAMNRFGQSDTQGALGGFCVGCHAPLAVSEALTSDGLNLDQIPDYAQGVGCYFCHDASAVHRQNNNGLDLADDDVMRGGIADPVTNAAHRSTFSDLHASAEPNSASLCGACHDVLTPSGVALERTFAEWNNSLFGAIHAPNRAAILSCNSCHMPTTQGQAANTPKQLPERTLHGHEFAAVDLALTAFPNTGDVDLDQTVAERQRALIGQLLDTSIGVEICVQRLIGETFAVYVTLENASAGHNWPSGAAQDRRAWVELAAYGDAPAPLYQSGVVQDGVDPDAADPDLWQFNDRMLDAEGNPVQMFWQAQSSESHTIPAALSNDPSSPDFLASHVTRRFPKDPSASLDGVPARVTVRVHIRPLGFALLDQLEAKAALDPTLRTQVPTFGLIPNRHLADHPELSSLATVTFEWSQATLDYPGFSKRTRNDDAFPKDCVSMTPQR